jgi:serine/threonine protein kinase
MHPDGRSVGKIMQKDEYNSAMREAELLASVHHPNVIRFYDSFIHDEMLHIVMEFAPHGTLKELLAGLAAPLGDQKASHSQHASPRLPMQRMCFSCAGKPGSQCSHLSA